MENAKKNDTGMVEYGRVTSIDCRNSLLYSFDNKQLIGAIGINDTLVVSTKDAVLLVDKKKVKMLKS